MRSPQKAHGITSISYHIHVSQTKSTCYLEALKSHAFAQPTSQSMIHLIPSPSISIQNPPYIGTTSYIMHLEKKNHT